MADRRQGAAQASEMGPEFDDVDWRQYDPRQYDPRRIVREALLGRRRPGCEPDGGQAATLGRPGTTRRRGTPCDAEAT